MAEKIIIFCDGCGNNVPSSDLLRVTNYGDGSFTVHARNYVPDDPHLHFCGVGCYCRYISKQLTGCDPIELREAAV